MSKISEQIISTCYWFYYTIGGSKEENIQYINKTIALKLGYRGSVRDEIIEEIIHAPLDKIIENLKVVRFYDEKSHGQLFEEHFIINRNGKKIHII